MSTTKTHTTIRWKTKDGSGWYLSETGLTIIPGDPLFLLGIEAVTAEARHFSYQIDFGLSYTTQEGFDCNTEEIVREHLNPWQKEYNLTYQTPTTKSIHVRFCFASTLPGRKGFFEWIVETTASLAKVVEVKNSDWFKGLCTIEKRRHIKTPTGWVDYTEHILRRYLP